MSQGNFTKNSLLLIIVFTFSFSNTFYAEIAFTEIKGLSSTVKLDEMDYNPLNGLVWWHAGIMENLYRYGDDKDATVKLVKELFYLQRDEITFDITSLNRKPARYFKATTIGKIIKKLRELLLESPLKPESVTAAKKELLQSIQDDIDLSALIKKSQEKIALQIANIQALDTAVSQLKAKSAATIETQKKIKNDLMSINSQIAHATRQKDQQKIDALEKEKGSINKRLQESEKSIDGDRKRIKEIGSSASYKKLSQVIHNESLTAKSLEELVNLIIDSLQECTSENSYYLRSATIQILLSFLWKKADAKKEFIGYFVMVPEILIDPSWLNNNAQIEEWIKMQFGEPDYSSFMAQITSTKSTGQSHSTLKIYLIDNYELAVFAALAQKMWYSVLPPIISSVSESQFQDGDQVYYFSNCAETAIRNFINIILKKPKSILLDIARLQQAAATNKFTVKPALIDFYRDNNAIATLETRKVNNAFNQVVSKLGKDIVYLIPTIVNGVCELRAILSNSLKVLNYILFNNDPEFAKMKKSEQLTMLCQKIKLPDFSLSWKADEGVDVNAQDFNVKVIFSINDKEAFEWQFKEHHALILAKEEESITTNANIMDALLEDFDKASAGIIPFNIIASYLEASKLYDTVNLGEINTPYAYAVVLACNTHNNDVRLSVVNLAMQNKNLRIPAIDAYIKKFMKSVEDDPYYTQELLIDGIKYGVPSFDQKMQEYLKEDTQKRGYAIALRVISEKDYELFPFIVPIIEKIKPEPVEHLKDLPASQNTALYQLVSLIVTQPQTDPQIIELYKAAFKRLNDLNSEQISTILDLIIFNEKYDSLIQSKGIQAIVKKCFDLITEQKQLKEWATKIVYFKKRMLYGLMPELLKKINDPQFEQELRSRTGKQQASKPQAVSWKKRCKKHCKVRIC